jgi:hypothetical protein
MTRDEIRDVAETQVADYPQYRHHFNTYQLATMRECKVDTAGLLFDKNEQVIFDPSIQYPEPYSTGTPYVIVWSMKRATDIVIRLDSLRF